MATAEAIVAAVTIVMMNSSSNHDGSNASADTKIDLLHRASREQSDINSPSITICLNRSLLVHHRQFQLLALLCLDSPTIFIDGLQLFEGNLDLEACQTPSFTTSPGNFILSASTPISAGLWRTFASASIDTSLQPRSRLCGGCGRTFIRLLSQRDRWLTLL